MPFQHSEDAADQARSIELFTALGNPLNLDFALRHQAIIERFGRFPHRNAVLGRASTGGASLPSLQEPGLVVLARSRRYSTGTTVSFSRR